MRKEKEILNKLSALCQDNGYKLSAITLMEYFPTFLRDSMIKIETLKWVLGEKNELPK